MGEVISFCRGVIAQLNSEPQAYDCTAADVDWVAPMKSKGAAFSQKCLKHVNEAAKQFFLHIQESPTWQAVRTEFTKYAAKDLQ